MEHSEIGVVAKISEANEQLCENVVISIEMEHSEIGVVTEISEADEQLCENVVISIETMLNQLPPVNKKCSIYRVPKQLRSMNHTAYTPQVISIGPFQHRRPNDLRDAEKYKLHCLINFLRRMKNKKRPLEFLVKTAKTWVREARTCYAESINMNDENFVKMMLVDGCFIVEYFLLSYIEYDPKPFPQIENNVDISFFEGINLAIYYDLTKLENQVPFFVLENLFGLIQNNEGNDLPFIVLTYVALDFGWLGHYEIDDVLSKKPKHLVDFLSFYYIPLPTPDMQEKQQHEKKKKKSFLSSFCFSKKQKQLEDNSEEKGLIIPPSITELQEAGVTLKKVEKAESVMDLSFKNGVLEIPPLFIYDSFEPLMRNLIAYEHFSTRNKNNYVIQYVMFMDYLISTQKDVSLLVEAGIIVNDIGGSDKEISELFNNLCKFVTAPTSYYFHDISKALREHCDGCWNKSKASLKHNYFNTPWAIVSFFAATFLIVLTILQTIFSAISIS